MKYLTSLMLFYMTLSACSIGDYNSKEMMKLPERVKFKRIETEDIATKTITIMNNNGLGGKTVISGGEINIYNSNGNRLININSNDNVGGITTYYKNGNQAINIFYDTKGDAGIWKINKRNVSKNYMTY